MGNILDLVPIESKGVCTLFYQQVTDVIFKLLMKEHYHIGNENKQEALLNDCDKTPVWKGQLSSGSGDVDRLSMHYSYPRGPATDGLGTECDNPAISYMTHLREKHRSICLSIEASELNLASWRTESSQTYDSLFGKWACWCFQRGCDPISGPIVNVANFLAHLHGEGYQSRSLNSYRSAIFSTHDTVDWFKVGEYPILSRLLKVA